MRRTEDIDIFLSPEKVNLQKALASLMDIFQDEELTKLNYSDFEEYPIIRYGIPQGFYIDLITKFEDALSREDVEPYVKWREIEGVKIPVPNIDILIKMKEKAFRFRERDKIDLIYLQRLRNLSS